MSDTFVLQPPIPFLLENNEEWLIFLAVSAASSTGDRAPIDWERATSLLAASASRTVGVASKIIDRSEIDPMLRMSVIDVVAELESDESLELLYEQTVRPLGDRDPQGGCEQSVDVEAMVAMAAIEGLVRLAARGNDLAVDRLVEVVARQPHVAIAEIAARAVVDARPDQRDEMVKLLGAAAGVLDVRPAKLEDMLIDPELDHPARKPDRRFTGPKPKLIDPDGDQTPPGPQTPCSCWKTDRGGS